MRKFLLFSLMVFSACFSQAQSVSINTDGSTAAASAMLDVKSTTKGMLVPRMTSTQRNAIASPANGLMTYDTDTKSFWYYDGLGWKNMAASAPGSSSGAGFFASGIHPTWRIAYLGSTKLFFDTENYDVGNGFTPITNSMAPNEQEGAYTVPQNGVYHFDAKVSLTLGSLHNFRCVIVLKLKRAGVTSILATNSSIGQPNMFPYGFTGAMTSVLVSADRMLQAGDLVWIEVDNYNDNDTHATINHNECYFNGHMLFAN